MRILVIDDDPCVAQAIQAMLCHDDVCVELDSTAAVARAATASYEGDPFDVVLCDIAMRGMNGFDVMTAMRQHPEPPMFILTAGFDEIVTAASLADGALLKPFRADEVLAMIGAIRKARKAASTRRIRRMLKLVPAPVEPTG